MSRFYKDLISALIFILGGLLLILMTPRLIADMGVSAIGPRSFPVFIGWGMLILGSILLFAAVHGKKQTDAEGQSPFFTKNELLVLGMIVILFLYVFAFARFGYFISTGVAATAILLLLGTRKVYYYLIVYVAAAVVYFAFTGLLNVILP